MSLLQLAIQKSFPATGLSPGFDLDVAMECDPGVTVLFGASGSGKTLTLDSTAGLSRPDQGRILLNNEILFDAKSRLSVPPQRRGMGYVFQNYALFPHMTVEENLSFGIARRPGMERRRKIREMLELFGLGALGSRRPHELSGGERQRASIARALVTEPSLLLLDEPARGLDYQLRVDFYAVLRNVRRKYSIPILLVTHDVTEGFILADQMVIYAAGRIVQRGKPDEVFARPRSAAVARLLGISNVFSGTVEELDPMADYALIRTPLFPVRVPYLPGRLRGDLVGFCIPQEHVTLLPPGVSREDRSRENRVPVRVVEEILLPNCVRLLLHVQGDTGSANGNTGPLQIESEVTRLAYKKMGLPGQKEWQASLPKAHIHVFGE